MILNKGVRELSLETVSSTNGVDHVFAYLTIRSVILIAASSHR
jgi:hypothetical protein